MLGAGTQNLCQPDGQQKASLEDGTECPFDEISKMPHIHVAGFR